MTGYLVEALTEDFGLGEAPHWSAEEQVLYFVDIFAQLVLRYDPTTGIVTRLHIEGGPITPVVPHASAAQTLVVGMGRSLAAVTWPDPTQDAEADPPNVLASVDQDKPANRFNDGKCDGLGRMWAGTMGDTSCPTNENPYQGGLYRMDQDRTVSKMVDQVSQSNGIAWSPDNTVLYFIDTCEYKVFGFDFDLTTGAITNRRVVFDFESSGLYPAPPDGMTIDADGNLWVAIFSAGTVLNINPGTGQVVRAVDAGLPQNTTSVAWGGPDLDHLYVTSAGGPLCRVTGLGVKGLPATPCVVDLVRK